MMVFSRIDYVWAFLIDSSALKDLQTVLREILSSIALWSQNLSIYTPQSCPLLI